MRCSSIGEAGDLSVETMKGIWNEGKKCIGAEIEGLDLKKIEPIGGS